MLRPWIARRVTELMKFEDDVVVEYVYSMLEDRDKPVSRGVGARSEEVLLVKGGDGAVVGLVVSRGVMVGTRRTSSSAPSSHASLGPVKGLGR